MLYSSAVTSAATGDVLRAADVVLVLEVVAELELVGERLPGNSHGIAFTRAVVAHVEYFIWRSQEFFRFAVAVQTPFHLQRGGWIHKWHPVHGTMAVTAPDSLVNMNAVIEIYVVGKVINARPVERFS